MCAKSRLPQKIILKNKFDSPNLRVGTICKISPGQLMHNKVCSDIPSSSSSPRNNKLEKKLGTQKPERRVYSKF